MNKLRSLLNAPGWGLFAFILLYVAGVWALSIVLGQGARFSLFLYSSAVVRVSVMLFLLFLGWRVYSLILFERPARLAHRLVEDVGARLFTPAQLRAVVPVFLAFMVFMGAFTTMKGLIPLVQPYRWDGVFAALDRAMHFGVDPWRVLQPVLGHGAITGILNVVYNLWFVVMFGVLYWQLFDLRRPALRMRFFWSFFLSWIVNGSVLAVALSSAGPCFYHFVVSSPDQPFIAQMAYLRDAAGHFPVWAVATQDRLWDVYQAGQTGIGSGISAMPSVHVALAVLFVLLSFCYGRMARVFFISFAVLIMLGSVHLAWHYAVDGYLSALVTLLIWWGTGLFIKERGSNEKLD